ncbi:MAG: hypothetical protein JW768_05625 [Chitinispirillaceae bacterium]|nr:hypothetical protein [Chitinispirillaceae bacterium]
MKTGLFIQTVVRSVACSALVTLGIALCIPSSAGAALSKKEVRATQKEIQKSIKNLEKQIEDLTDEREQLRRKQLAGSSKEESKLAQLEAQLQRIDKQIADCDSSLAGFAKKKTSAKKKQSDKITILRKKNLTLEQQKQEVEARMATIESKIKKARSQHSQTIRSANNRQKNYQKRRLPYENAYKEAEIELRSATEERDMLISLKQKLQYDLEVHCARDSLDKVIQLRAGRKRGAKKLVEKWEDVLDALNSKQDELIRSHPSMRKKEGELSGTTIALKIASADKAIVAAKEKARAATGPYQQAKKRLENFERTNPQPGGPSEDRIGKLDAMIESHKKELFMLSDQSDSLGMLIQEARNTIASYTSPGPSGIDDLDSLAVYKEKEKADLERKRLDLAKQRAALRPTMSTKETKLESEIARATSKIDSLANELAVLKERRDSLEEGVAPDELQVSDADNQSRSARLALAGLEGLEDEAAAKETEIEDLIAEQKKTREIIKHAEKTLLESSRTMKDQERAIKLAKRDLRRIKNKQKALARKLPDEKQTGGKQQGTEIAQQRLEEIYDLLSSESVASAVNRFRQLRPFLKAKLDPEAFETLVSTLEQMGGILE